VNKQQTKRWQAKMFLHEMAKRLAAFALGLRKHEHDLWILVGLLTGHCILNRHDPLCSACGEEETSLHFLGKCCATVQTRHRMLELTHYSSRNYVGYNHQACCGPKPHWG